MILALGDPIKGQRLGIHTRRSLAHLPTEQQLNRIEGVAREGGLHDRFASS